MLSLRCICLFFSATLEREECSLRISKGLSLWVIVAFVAAGSLIVCFVPYVCCRGRQCTCCCKTKYKKASNSEKNCEADKGVAYNSEKPDASNKPARSEAIAPSRPTATTHSKPSKPSSSYRSSRPTTVSRSYTSYSRGGGGGGGSSSYGGGSSCGGGGGGGGCGGGGGGDF